MKLTVRYDKNLNANVFVVRDDESYVSSTKTILNVSDPYFRGGDYLNCIVDITINVLREIGESKVVLYDGDNVLKAYDWSGQSISDELTFPVNTHHSLRAVFMGNNHCLRSQSKVCEVYQEGTDYPVSIRLTSPISEIIIDNANSFSFQLRDSEHSVPVPSGNLIISYTDNTHNDIKTVEVDDGDASVTFPSLDEISEGRIDFTAVYEGTSNYGRSVMGFSKSKNFIATLTGSRTTQDNRWIIGEDYTVTGKTVSFVNGHGIYFPVEILGYDGNNWETIAQGRNNEYTGEFSIVLRGSDYPSAIPYTELKYQVTSITTRDKFKPVFTPTYVDVTGLNVTPYSDSYSIMDNFVVDVSGDIYPSGEAPYSDVLSGIPIHVTNTSLGINDTFYTDTQGRAVCNYTKSNIPNGTILGIKVGTLTDTYTILHYLTMYVAPYLNGQNLKVSQATSTNTSSGMRYTANPTQNNPTKIYPYMPTNLLDKKQSFRFTVVSSESSQFYYGVMDSRGDTKLWEYPTGNWLGTGDVCEYIYDPAKHTLTCTVTDNTSTRVRFTEDTNNGSYIPCIVNLNKQGSLVLNNIYHEVL